MWFVGVLLGLGFLLVWFDFCGNMLFEYISTSVLEIYFDLSVLFHLNRTATTLLCIDPFGIKRGFTVRGYVARLNEY